MSEQPQVQPPTPQSPRNLQTILTALSTALGIVLLNLQQVRDLIFGSGIGLPLVVLIVVGLIVYVLVQQKILLMQNAVIIVIAVCVGLGISALSQEAIVTGQLNDPNGSPIGNLRLTLSNSEGIDQHTTTTADGRFVFRNVPDGHYTITANGQRLYTGNVPSAPQRLLSANEVSIGGIISVNTVVVANIMPTDISPTDAPTRTPQPTNTVTNTTTPTFTPTTTPSFTPTLENFSILYDDFNNSQYDGSIQTNFWSTFLVDSCEIRQRSGVLIFSNREPIASRECLASPYLLAQGRLDDLNVFQFSAKFLQENSRGGVRMAVLMWSDETGQPLYCGFNSSNQLAAEFMMVSENGSPNTWGGDMRLSRTSGREHRREQKLPNGPDVIGKTECDCRGARLEFFLPWG